jgi:hypothetical protein
VAGGQIQYHAAAGLADMKIAGKISQLNWNI